MCCPSSSSSSSSLPPSSFLNQPSIASTIAATIFIFIVFPFLASAISSSAGQLNRLSVLGLRVSEARGARPEMKRPLAGEDAKMKKKVKHDQEFEEEGGGAVPPTGFAHLDENLLFEVLKHADARTLAMAACVSKLWHRTAQDERLWELICTRHWPNIGCGNQQLRSVVLALGGFRRLHSLYLPLSKQQQQQQPGSASSSSAPPSASAWATPLPPMMGVKPQTRWGKDEVHLFLSLLSIRCYEKMNFTGRGR
ncbi:hypothetical protein NL676_024863 [Syzygium grande]|nr:hypothetical protein NL676_024863 [Syzygium grande]